LSPDPARPGAFTRLKALGEGLRALSRTTTFRVAIAFAGLFAGFAILLLGYIYAATAGRLGLEADAAARGELEELAQVWETGGVRALNVAVIDRAASTTDGLYVLLNPDGTLVSGNIDAVPLDLSRVARPGPDEPLDTGAAIPASFRYERPDAPFGDVVARRARGVFLAGPDGHGLFVARDLGPGVEIADQVARVVFTGGAAVLAFALIGGYAAARQAAGRVEELSRTARAVMGGDLSRRAAVRPARPGEGDEFDALTLDLNSMLDRIERLVAAARTTGDSIAHDLRSPLTRLRARLETAAADARGVDALREAVETAVREIDDVVATFNAVLRLSRLEAGEGGRLETMDLCELGRELADMFEPAVEEAGLAFTAHIAPALPIRADRSLLAQAVSNLLDNAIKYTGKGAVRLHVGVRPDGRAEIAVADTGPGIAPEDRARAVRRFVRLDGARSSPGSGIGLSLAAAVAEVHGGTLELGAAGGEASEAGEASEGAGLRVAIVLPRSP
jgi:signal transduction histidine kinase